MPAIVIRLLIAAGVAVVVWVVKAGVCMAAVRIHAGTRPSPVDAEEIVWRSAVAAAFLTLITPVEILAFDDLFTAGVASGVFWLVAFVAVPVGGLLFSWVYALDDYVAGLGIFGLYCLAPFVAMGIFRLASIPVRTYLLRIF